MCKYVRKGHRRRKSEGLGLGLGGRRTRGRGTRDRGLFTTRETYYEVHEGRDGPFGDEQVVLG